MDQDMTKQRVRRIKYGGISYVNNVPLEEINQFVENLPEEDRSSMAEVTNILVDRGMITLVDDKSIEVSPKTEW